MQASATHCLMQDHWTQFRQCVNQSTYYDGLNFLKFGNARLPSYRNCIQYLGNQQLRR
jgi:predicted ATPase